ncbi:MAG TPA: hypothetical protein PLP05_06440 [Sedimentisphaerales bacterium]|nr:hypothetical protein [Sedimentisphaerales bacterium]
MSTRSNQSKGISTAASRTNTIRSTSTLPSVSTSTRSITRTIPTRVQRTVSTSTSSLGSGTRSSTGLSSSRSIVNSSSRTATTRSSKSDSTSVSSNRSPSSLLLATSNRNVPSRSAIVENIHSRDVKTGSDSRTSAVQSDYASVDSDSTRSAKSGDRSANSGDRSVKSDDRSVKSDVRTGFDKGGHDGGSPERATNPERASKDFDAGRGVGPSPEIRKNDHLRPFHDDSGIRHKFFAPVVRHDFHGREYCYRDYYSHRSHHNYWDFRLFGYWPSSCFTVAYETPGLSLSFSYVYPNYHRKYVFVSVGGWWPSDYTYVRYYWYGYHPYRWYGYYPEVYAIDGGGDVNSNNTTSTTNNYYTYNNYYGDSGSGTTKTVLDSSQLAAAEQQAAITKSEPAPEGRADELFNAAVKAFEDGTYDKAANLFAEAMRTAGDDIILPFAYSQALFADGQYVSATQALRTAFEKLPADKDDMFYPRGLYADEETLTQQIDTLGTKLDSRAFDTDLQLLLGYHMVGIGELDKAIPHLQIAAGASENKPAVDKLLKLIERVQKQEN